MRAEDLPAARPLDEHNQRLLDHVHPSGWVNPEPRDRYDLVVLGGGTGGLVTAAIGAALGARVALVERHLMGGDCLNVGCVPSKAMLRAARGWADARAAAARFGGPPAAGDGDFAAAMERMRALRADIAAHDSAARFRDLGVDVFLGDGRFVAEDRVEVEGRILPFRRAVIATGGRPVLPPIPGLAEASPLTNESVFSLTELPPRLAIIGGGPIGCELAQAFARFGSRVTLLEAEERLLGSDDPDAAGLVRGALERDGVEVRTGVTVERVELRGEESRLHLRGGDAVDADRVLAAAGRAPNVEGMGLEVAGVRVGPHGVEVDDRLRTSNHRVYAVGDVTPGAHFTHAADAHARMVVQNALFFGRKQASDLVIPGCTYTTPEVAQVGIGAREAAERADEVETLTVPFSGVDRARLDGSTEGFLRVHLRRGSDRILGATLVHEHAGELIAPLALAVTHRIGLGSLGSTILPYPTLAEVVRRAADAHRRGRLTPRVRRGFELLLRVLR